MSVEFQRAAVYNDFQGLGDLRRAARAENPDALSETTRQFEAVFMQMLLKTMRETTPGDPLFDSPQLGFYQEMFDQQLSLDLARSGGIGLAEVMQQQLGGEGMRGRVRRDLFADPGSFSLDRHMARAFPAPQREMALGVGHIVREVATSNGEAERTALEAARTRRAAANPYRPASVGAIERIQPLPREPDFSSPEAFVAEIWPHAERAARELGTSPKVLVAQAALETGWGRHVIRRADGESSNNLFNIKADRRWDGSRASVSTLEYRDGVAVRERAAFRSYGSIEESFDDYVAFIRNSPRYSEALQQAHDPDAYIRELHSAGYATDPEYAAKVQSIMRRSWVAGSGESAEPA